MSNVYIDDILTQAQALEEAIHAFSQNELTGITEAFQSGTFDRVVISGMGASINAAYPAYMILAQSGIPVIFINSAELLHYFEGSIGKKTLLWINSQSGRSVEIVRLLEKIRKYPPAALISCVNDAESPLARESSNCILIQAGMEATVSVKTYSNMLAVNLLLAYQLCGVDVEELRKEMLESTVQLSDYLRKWEDHLDTMDSMLGDVKNLIFLGRGSSMAAVWNGALISKEAAKCAFEGLHAAEFRHGPLELAEPGFKALIFSGLEPTWQNNEDLAKDVMRYGGDVIWVDRKTHTDLPTFLIPEVKDSSLGLAEILAVQILSVVMARRKGIEAGVFRYVGKITTKE